MNIVVKWNKMGPEFSYYVLYARNPEGPWVRDNDIRLTDDIIDILRGLDPANYYGAGAELNEYTIKNLDEQTKYSFKVTCKDRYDAWWYSYKGPETIAGGLGSPHTQPNPDNGNILSFQFEIL